MNGTISHFVYVILYNSNVGKMNVNNDAKSLQMETFLIDDQHNFNNTLSEKEDVIM